MVVLSIGMTPRTEAARRVAGPIFKTGAEGFLAPAFAGGGPEPCGVFAAGAATGPMSIAETVASAGHTAARVLAYLGSGTGKQVGGSNTG